MESLQAILPAALAELFRQGPLSQAKLELAWRLAVGEKIGRVTRVSLRPEGLVHVEPVDQRWVTELRRSSRVILSRLQSLLGTEAVTRVAFVSASETQRGSADPKVPSH